MIYNIKNSHLNVITWTGKSSPGDLTSTNFLTYPGRMQEIELDVYRRVLRVEEMCGK